MESPTTGRTPSFEEIEQEVELEVREYARQLLRRRLRERAGAPAARISPPPPLDGQGLRDCERRSRRVRSLHGEIELVLWYGRSRSGRWHCPMLLEGGITGRSRFTPAARRRIAAAACLTGTFQEASEICQEWGLQADDSTVHSLVAKMGASADELALRREAAPVPVPEVPRAPAPFGVLMVDGCLLRFRGQDWGRKKPSETHVEWHELKLGVYFASDGQEATSKGRRTLAEKRVFSSQPHEVA